jgi:hypothetical protein
VIDAVGEALSSGILADDANGLNFPAPLLRSALYESMPASVRALRHRQTARVFAEAGMAPERVAAQIVQASVHAGDHDDWTVDWLGRSAAALLYSVPRLAVELLRNLTGRLSRDDPRREPMEAALAMAAFLRGEFAEAESTAIGVLARTDSAERAGEMSWLLGYTLMVVNRLGEAAEVVTSAPRRRALGAVWEARLHYLHAAILYTADRNDAAREMAEEALERGRALGDAQTLGYTSNLLGMVKRFEHDMTGYLNHLDEGLVAVADIPELTDCRLLLLTNKMLGQLEVDMADEAIEATVNLARRVAEQAGTVRVGMVADCAAFISYTRGTGTTRSPNSTPSSACRGSTPGPR